MRTRTMIWMMTRMRTRLRTRIAVAGADKVRLQGEDVEVMRAESLMALTNLTLDSDIERLCPEPGILSVLTQMLLCAIRGQVSLLKELALLVWAVSVKEFTPRTIMSAGSTQRSRLASL